MLEINKYLLELAIDQYKLKDGKKVDFAMGEMGFEYGSEKFMSREQAENWLRSRTIDKFQLMEDIRRARRTARVISHKEDKGNKFDDLEGLFQIFESYYGEENKIRKNTQRKLGDISDPNVEPLIRAKSVPKVTIPKYELFGLGFGGDLDLDLYKSTERILPLTDLVTEGHSYTFRELGLFLQKSIESLSGEILSVEILEKVASRIVRIKGDSGSGTGFISDGKLYTNDHVIRDNGKVEVYDLMGNEIPIQTYILPEDEPEGDLLEKDITMVNLPDGVSQKYRDPIDMGTGTYIIGLKPIHLSLAQGGKDIDNVGIWIQKTTIKRDYVFEGRFHYSGGANNVGGTSGSMVIENGKIIGIHALKHNHPGGKNGYHQDEECDIEISTGRILGERIYGTATRDGRGKRGGGFYLDN